MRIRYKKVSPTRFFISLWLIIGTLAFSQNVTLNGAPTDGSDNPRPNIIVILVDDLGFSDLGCYGASIIQTPTIDHLADQGLRFTQFYNTAKCHSSRICLLTGLYPYQAGQQAMDNGCTIPEVLRPAGYFTAMAGKWHLQREPTNRGFDRYFGHLSGATDYFVGDNTFRLNGKKWSEFNDNFYTTDANTDYSIKFIDEAIDLEKPFFLYLAYNAPHYPLQAPKRLIDKYRDKFQIGWDKLRRLRYERQLNMGLINPSWELSPRPDYIPAWASLSSKEKEWEAFRMAVYAAMLDSLDQNISRLIKHLKARGIYNNTLIMFCSDNGACPFERSHNMDIPPWKENSHWTYDVGWAHVGNTPFRWYKQNQHEGGISTPLIVHWPDGLTTKAGAIHREPCHLIDIMPTIIDLTKANYPEQGNIEPLQGMSLIPSFNGRSIGDRDWLYFIFNDNRAIRKGNWKLVSAEWGKWELYNMTQDRTELHDLSNKNVDTLAELKQLWYRVARDVDNAPKRLRKPVFDRNPIPPFKRAKNKMPTPPKVP
ncbi:MAG: arylsulfatase [Verrucomicrobia bacterium]|nr:arylsulfatase [Verrucomicrobiota bacterium]MCF7707684.1 arylsulfatase [Verrucomicrobiota bacterium]